MNHFLLPKFCKWKGRITSLQWFFKVFNVVWKVFSSSHISTGIRALCFSRHKSTGQFNQGYYLILRNILGKQQGRRSIKLDLENYNHRGIMLRERWPKKEKSCCCLFLKKEKTTAASHISRKQHYHDVINMHGQPNLKAKSPNC